MAVAKISGITISYPETPESPIISVKHGAEYDVFLRLDKRGKSPVVTAQILRHADRASTLWPLKPRDVSRLHQQTRARLIVGLMQPHYAETIKHWVENAAIDPFGDIAAEDDHRKTA
ncbi:hypothetical protein VRRI112168_02670 [Vreelandella rituensis]|uniref:Uncharacterized protein n=1 Tax=Vreelandella rituensis TaxID=2282306 RepID=A0A368U8X6_9GAMM|nr:hypothetical protein [Halomonas rituensis]RCV93648.1 hypothetical protein DU506_00390 [Halomonas rituensis]